MNKGMLLYVRRQPPYVSLTMEALFVFVCLFVSSALLHMDSMQFEKDPQPLLTSSSVLELCFALDWSSFPVLTR